MSKGLVANPGRKLHCMLLALLRPVDWSYSFALATRPDEKCGLTTRRGLGSDQAAGELPGILGNVLEDDQKLL
jgi:hypothetical protein